MLSVHDEISISVLTYVNISAAASLHQYRYWQDVPTEGGRIPFSWSIRWLVREGTVINFRLKPLITNIFVMHITFFTGIHCFQFSPARLWIFPQFYHTCIRSTSATINVFLQTNSILQIQKIFSVYKHCLRRCIKRVRASRKTRLLSFRLGNTTIDSCTTSRLVYICTAQEHL